MLQFLVSITYKYIWKHEQAGIANAWQMENETQEKVSRLV